MANITGTNGDDSLLGTATADFIQGLQGNDTLDDGGGGGGGGGIDTLVGGLGDDIYLVNDSTDLIQENVGEGTDVVKSTQSFNLSTNGQNVEILTLLGAGNIDGTGNALGNVITGNTGDNTLDGGGGTDTLVGGAGNDTYIVDDLTDVVGENPGEGTDIILSSIDYSISTLANVENLTLTGAALAGTGNAGVNIITGNGNDNTLDGGAGADTMIGDLGNDTYLVDNAADVIIEGTAAGTDTVDTVVNYTLDPAQDIENLILDPIVGAINGTGNGLDNVITGNGAINTIDGGAGNDTLDGGAGVDTLIGGLGNDTFIVDDPNDVVTEAVGEGTDTIRSSVDFDLSPVSLANVENLTLTGGAIVGTGNALDNVITGNGNDNTLDGGLGADAMAGGTGDDTYFVDNAGDTVTEIGGEGIDTISSSIDFNLSTNGANVENLILTGTALVGTGDAGDNVITSNGLIDTLTGGLGNDTFIVNNSADVLSENVGEGTDTVLTNVTYTLTAGQEIENVTITGAGALDVTGNDFDNNIVGNASVNVLNGGIGNDTLDGKAGADTMIGGLGNDTFVVDNINDLVSENGGEGTDTVSSSVDFDLSTNGLNVENLTLTGTAIIGTGDGGDNVITGNANNNTLSGLGGNDTLIGGAGADTMIGGLGNDIFFVDDPGDVVIEGVGAGTDTISSSIDFSLAASGANVENLILTGAAIFGTGDSGNNFITGNANNNTLTGGGGNDTLDGGLGADRMVGGTGNDTYYVDNVGDVLVDTGGTADTVISSISFTLATGFENLTLTGSGNINGTGNGSANIINGNSGNNTLNGLGGADTMIGGGGNDTYIVDSTLDVVTGGAGIDTIQSSVTINLSIPALSNIENLTLTGTAVINGTGNALDNIITGNSAVNVLSGGAGNDTLNGGAGADTMSGGTGNDTFTVDNAADVVLENAGEGTADTVLSSVTFSMTNANLENLTLTGAANINGTGNAQNNIITGNSGNNTLNGGLGNDTLAGGLGNDVYVIDTLTDVITDTGGTDTIISSVTVNLGSYTGIENLTLSGTAAINGTGDGFDNVLTGNGAVNVLTGGAGNDTIDGKAGADTMIGGFGDDTFYVDNAADVVIENGGGGTDTIIITGGLTSFVLPANVENVIYLGTAGGKITGDAGNNTLTGGPGNDIINGLGGADVMIGGKGADTYYVDNSNDVVVENAGEGTDKIIATASATLTFYDMFFNAPNVENFTLTATTMDFVLFGNSSDNFLVTSSGNDIIFGEGGHNTMNGGAGNDTYFADFSDVIVDGSGHDTVETYNHYTMPNNIEDLILFDPSTPESEFYANGNKWSNLIDGSSLTQDYTLSGFGGADTILGGTGADTLDGGVGADTMSAGDGDDTYFVDNSGDVVIENTDEGTDILNVKAPSYVLLATSEVEEINLTNTTQGQHFTSSDTDNTITGGAFSDVIDAGGGDDTIYGGGGKDFITGGTGQDTFVFKFDTAFLHITYITDFNVTDTGNLSSAGDGPLAGDVLDIGDIMSNVTGIGHLERATDWVRFLDSNGDTLVQIDTDGAANVSHFQTIAVLLHVTGFTSEIDLLIDKNIDDGGFFS